MSEDKKKAVRADTMGLKIIAISARTLGTYTAALAAFFILMAGILDLFAIKDATLNPFVPALADFGLFLAGIFIGTVVFHTMAKRLYILNTRREEM